jgi:hypothetical protein
MRLAILIGTVGDRSSAGNHEFLVGSQGFMEHNDVPIAEH